MTRIRFKDCASAMSWLAVATGLVATLLINPFQGAAQSQTTASYQFEAASIKPNSSGLLLETSFRFDPGRLTVTNLPLGYLITHAYGIKEFQLSGGPSWLHQERFDIAATASGNVGQDRLMLMLQTLLADRFKLKLHRETHDQASDVMVVAKNGAGLKRAKEDEQPKPIQLNPRRLAGTKASMVQLASMLSSALGRSVIDRTELQGDFDFYVEWTPDPGVVPSSPGFYDPLLPAIQDQLGLRFKAQKSPVEIIVIDYAERPSAN